MKYYEKMPSPGGRWQGEALTDEGRYKVNAE